MIMIAIVIDRYQSLKPEHVDEYDIDNCELVVMKTIVKNASTIITWMRRNEAVVSPFSVICETPPRGES